jgi:hypothetical protein
MPSSIELPEAGPAWAPPAIKPLDEAAWQAWLAKGRARDQRNTTTRTNVLKWVGIAGLLAAAAFWSQLKAATPADLSKYRGFQFGTNLLTVAKQTGANVSQATVIHRRPALMQELQWHPQPLGASSQTEPAQQVVFSFYDGELYRITVDYDRFETEGLTVDDFVEAISATYGTATRPTVVARISRNYGDPADILAQWQDAQYRFELVRDSYAPTFRLVGVSKRLEEPAQAASLEAKRLDDEEAPQRDAARLASEEGAAKAKLEGARLVNKQKFRP